MRNKKTILLTGATGFIGSHLLEKLVSENHRVIILIRQSSDTWRIKHLLDKVEVYVLEEIKLDQPFKDNKIDCVMHLAGTYIKVHSNVDDIQKLINSNIRFPSMLCEACVTYKVSFFVNTGSFFEFEQKSSPLTEDDLISPYDFYAATKQSFSDILRFYSKMRGLNVVDFNLASIFGEKDNEKLFAFLSKSFLKKKEIDMSGGYQTWNFTYVKDIVDAYSLVLKKMDVISGYEMFNIGNNEVHTIRDIAEGLKRISGRDLKINWGAKPYPPNEIFYAKCYSSKAKEIIGWEAKTSFDEALENTYNYFTNQLKGGKNAKNS